MAIAGNCQNVLLQNIPLIIGYVKSQVKDNAQKIAISEQYISRYKKQLQTASTEKSINRYTGETESSDADDYKFYIAQEEQHLSKLQSQSRYFGALQNVLNDILDVQLRMNEIQEVLNWQSSAAYAAITRYDPDEAPEVNYEEQIQQYENKLDVLCEKCLKYPEIQAYITMIISSKKKQKITNSRVTVRRR